MLKNVLWLLLHIFERRFAFFTVRLNLSLTMTTNPQFPARKTMSLNRPSCRHTPRLGSAHMRSCSMTDPSPSRELRISTAEPSNTTGHFTAKFEFPSYGCYWWNAGGVIEWGARMSQKRLCAKWTKDNWTAQNSWKHMPKGKGRKGGEMVIF